MEDKLKKAEKEKTKRMLKKKILPMILPIFIPILIVVIIGSSLLSVFTTMVDKLIELASNIKTTVASFWKWFTDDYWIKLDKEIEFEVLDQQTRRNDYKKEHISR